MHYEWLVLKDTYFACLRFIHFFCSSHLEDFSFVHGWMEGGVDDRMGKDEYEGALLS